MAEVDFGTDIDAVEDITPNLTLVSGPQNLAQAVVRHFITEEGFLRDVTGDDEAGDYGWDLRAQVNQGQDPGVENVVSTFLKKQAVQDPRVIDAKVKATFIREESVFNVEVILETPDGLVAFTRRIGLAPG